MSDGQGGSEGDEILFFSLRQIQCPIPAGMSKVGELAADLLVEIIARAMLLITEGEAQFPLKLPPNIASRHRICTSMAAKIKEMGYIYDCGYNQLLYPVETQSRNLLKWLVQRLPRSEEEGAQGEVLGASALMNRRILHALEAWKACPRQLPCCLTNSSGSSSGGGVRVNSYSNRVFKTLPLLLVNKTLLEQTVPLYNSLRDQNQKQQQQVEGGCELLSLEHSIFERHALQLVNDSKYAQRLEQDFVDPDAAAAEGEVDDLQAANAVAAGAGAVDEKGSSSGGVMALAAKRALLAAMRATGVAADSSSGSSSSGGTTAADTATATGGSSSRVAFAEEQYNKQQQQKLLGASFQELIQSIAEDQKRGGGGASAGDGSRGTRFTHAVEFGQDAESSVAIGAAADGKLFATAARAAAAADAATAAALASSAVAMAKSGFDARKSQQEAEELARQEELELLRKEVQDYVAAVEQMTRSYATVSVRTKEFEEELEKMNADTESVEKDVIMKRKTLELLPSAADNIKKLQEQCSDGSGRLLLLAEEWDAHRQPLVQQLREKENLQLKRREKGRQMVEEIKRYRQDMASMIEDLKEKQDRAQLLGEESAKLPKNINRAMYTHRIMDITASIVKQNRDIEKITADIRDIQKTVNLSTSSLQRADTFTEELIFSAASDRNDSVMVDIYRQLRNLRAKFEELISTVGKIGRQEKSNRDLETKIDQEQSRISSNNFDRIKQDLDSIAQENAQLVQQIKSATAAAAAKKK